MKLIPGFDYRIGKQVEHTRAGWREEMLAIVRAGGFRSIVDGETWVYQMNKHGPHTLAFEVYANIKDKTDYGFQRSSQAGR